MYGGRGEKGNNRCTPDWEIVLTLRDQLTDWQKHTRCTREVHLDETHTHTRSGEWQLHCCDSHSVRSFITLCRHFLGSSRLHRSDFRGSDSPRARVFVRVAHVCTHSQLVLFNWWWTRAVSDRWSFLLTELVNWGIQGHGSRVVEELLAIRSNSSLQDFFFMFAGEQLNVNTSDTNKIVSGTGRQVSLMMYSRRSYSVC